MAIDPARQAARQLLLRALVRTATTTTDRADRKRSKRADPRPEREDPAARPPSS